MDLMGRDGHWPGPMGQRSGSAAASSQVLNPTAEVPVWQWWNLCALHGASHPYDAMLISQQRIVTPQSCAGFSPMAHVIIDIVSACNQKRCTMVIPRHEYGPTIEGVYTGLESGHREEGQLKDNTGRCIGRAEGAFWKQELTRLH